MHTLTIIRLPTFHARQYRQNARQSESDEKKNLNILFLFIKKYASNHLFLFHFSDAKLEISKFIVQFSDTLVYRSTMGHAFCQQDWIVILL